MKEVVKLIELHCNKQKVDIIRGLDVTTDYLIDFFDIKHYMNGGWEKHVAEKKRESEELFRILILWIDKVSDAIERGGWLDMFGEVYEAMYQSKGKASALGQFFTPPPVCDVMANLCGDDNNRKVNDSACGSGRTLLAQWAQSNNKDGYFIGEDLDPQSIKMCALNMMAHGMRGRVVRHDSILNQLLFDYGFEINEIRYPFPTPYYSLRKIRKTKEDVIANNELLKKKFGEDVVVEKLTAEGELMEVYYPPKRELKHHNKPKTETPAPVDNKNVKPIQLSLFE